MNHWTPLWSMIVDSSLWSEPDFVCKIFVTMLALKDSDNVCRCNAYQLARRSHKTEEEVLEALKLLSSPDKKRLEPQEFDGRRIEAVEDGWLILNGPKYQEMVQKEMEKARWRRAQAERRRKEKLKALKNGVPLAGEIEAKQNFEAGYTDDAGQWQKSENGALPDALE